MEGDHIHVTDERPLYHHEKTGHRKLVFLVIALAAVLFITLLSYRARASEPLDDPAAYNPITLEPKKPEGFIKKLGYIVLSHETRLEGERRDRINILLLGMGGPGHDGPYLTDTIIIASIKPSTKQIALISIPRDLGIKIPGYGIRKINLANSVGETEHKGGGAYATELIADTFDIDIPYYIRIDFQAFKEIIDEIGGITVNVDRSFIDREYPTAGGGYMTVHFSQGIQKMDGDTALEYARSRHGDNGEGSDFARAERQQKILLAVKEKLLSFSTLTNPLRIKNTIDALEAHMTTNMEFKELLALIRTAREFHSGQLKKLVLDNGPDGFLQEYTGTEGAYYLAPKTGNFKTINKTIEHIFDATYTASVDQTPAQEGMPMTIEPSETKKPIQTHEGPVMEIQNGTWQAGLAARVKARLVNKGFDVETLSNTDVGVKPIAGSGIYFVGKNKSDENLAVVARVQRELNIPIKQKVQSGIAIASSTDILIILGDDFKE